MKFKDSKDFKDYLSVFKSSGVFHKEGEVDRVELKDALSHENATHFFPTVVETIVREAIEPMLVGTNLLERVNYQNGMQISFATNIGAMVAEDIGQTGEYPETGLNFGPGAQIVSMGKSGLAIKFSDDLFKHSNFDMLNVYLRGMGRALARLKESKIWSMLSSVGITTHNNVSPSDSIFGTTTGYDYTGTANGSLTLEDIYAAYSAILENGFIADTLIVNPLTYTMFLSDPVLRTMALEHGGGAWFNGWNGSGQNKFPFNQGSMGQAGPGAGPASAMSNLENIPNGSPKIPGYLGLPIRIIASPFVPYNKTTKLTDIYFVDSNSLGALIVEEEATMEEIPDRLHEITKIKMRERYAIQPYNDGNAIAVMRYIKVEPNRMTPSIQPTMSGGTFTPITDQAGTAVITL